MTFTNSDSQERSEAGPKPHLHITAEEARHITALAHEQGLSFDKFSEQMLVQSLQESGEIKAQPQTKPKNKIHDWLGRLMRKILKA